MEDEEIVKNSTESENGYPATEANKSKNEIPVQTESGVEKKYSKKPLFIDFTFIAYIIAQFW